MKEMENHKKIITGTIFILIGFGWIVKNMDILPWEIERIIFSWQMILITIGVAVFVSNKDKRKGIILMGIGGFFLLPKVLSLPFSMHNMFWPLVFVGVGVLLIVKWSGREHKGLFESSSSDTDFVDEVAVFGGGEKKIHTKNFKGGKVTAIFGGVELNLLDAELAEGVNELEVSYIFGGGTIIVPPDWKVIVKVTYLFGGFSDKRSYNPSYVTEPRKILVIKGSTVFGGGEVKSHK